MLTGRDSLERSRRYVRSEHVFGSSAIIKYKYIFCMTKCSFTQLTGNSNDAKIENFENF